MAKGELFPEEGEAQEAWAGERQEKSKEVGNLMEDEGSLMRDGAEGNLVKDEVVGRAGLEEVELL